MINDVKKLLNLLGISYIRPEVGEGEAFASELCKMGFVDWRLDGRYGYNGIWMSKTNQKLYR